MQCITRLTLLLQPPFVAATAKTVAMAPESQRDEAEIPNADRGGGGTDQRLLHEQHGAADAVDNGEKM
jgi:hypothetical protein